MKMSELFRKTDEALETVEAKRESHDAAVQAHAENVERAKSKLQKETDVANAERDRCVADAQSSYDASVRDTEKAREQAVAELASAQAELDVLRAQVGTLLGLEKSSNSRATVVSG